MLITKDLDGTFEWVQASGAEVVQEPMGQYWGTATTHSADPAGHLVASTNCAERTARQPPWCCNRNGVHVMGNASQEIDAIIRKSDNWRGEMLSRIRGIVLSTGPAVVEEVKWKKPSRPEGVPVWSLDGILCIGEMLKNAVRLTFPKGAQIKDPKKLFNARLNSSSVRAIDFCAGEKIPEAALKALIVEAVGLNLPSL